MKNSFILLASTALLVACVTANGPAYKPNLAKNKIVVYRPAEFGVPRSAGVAVNGTKVCDMPAKSFIILDGDSGANELTANVWDMGTSRITVDKPSYVRMTWDRGASAGNALGALGAMASNAIAGGPFEMIEVSKAQAESDLAGLKQSCN